MITANSTYLIIHLQNWPDGGCPITYFVLKYKEIEETEWQLISNKIQPPQSDFTILGLNVGTWYNIEITAHNAAGFQVARYTIATLTVEGGKVVSLIAYARVCVSINNLIPIR